MLDSIRLKCPFCNAKFSQSVAYVTGQIKAMKIYKRDQVAQQMADKRGPFYDKWLKAMKARGEQKRCSDCSWMGGVPDPHLCYESTLGHRKVSPSWFACKNFLQDL